MRSLAATVLTILILAGAAVADESPTVLNALVGRSLVLDSPLPLRRVAVTDPAIASATVIGPHQVLLHGLQPGTVTLLLWDDQEKTRSFDLTVERDLKPLQKAMRQALPHESIEVTQTRGSILLSGQVSSKAVGDQAVALAQAHAEKVVSLLGDSAVQVSLKVRVAEINRSAVNELGVTLFTTGLAGSNLIGQTSTRQFSEVLGNVGAVPADVQRGRDPNAANLASGGIGATAQGTPAVFGLNDLLNIFFFLPDRNVGAVVRALEQKRALEILAEPTLLARSGREASFLAGGEFPFPVVQGVTGGAPVISIVFREFGIRLKFTPAVSTDNRIGLKLVQEVSALDYANALTISGSTVPALSTRRTETELQLVDGQSFAISGLLDKRLTETASKVPGLGDIPILGKLFRSRSKQRSDSELLVIVTPTLVPPLQAGQTPHPPPSLELQRMKDEGMLSDDKKEGEVGPGSGGAAAEEGAPTPVPLAEADVTAPATPPLEVPVDGEPPREEAAPEEKKTEPGSGGGEGQGGTRQ
jgi:pilus assembly protein CpaC